jgi:hypothetical protein
MNELIQKALSVIAGGNLEAFLPKPIARQIIQNIREKNVMRRHIRTFNQKSRFFTKLQKLGGTSAYFVPDGFTATQSGYKTRRLTWEAKKLMALTPVEEEAIEDTSSVSSVVKDLLADFAEAIAEAEEMAILDGDPSHLATAPTPDSATDANWYQFDPRLIFIGLSLLATSSNASTPVDGGNGDIDLDMFNRAIFNLGKFGRNKRKLKCYVPSVQAMKIREDDTFKNASVSGLNLSSVITGLDNSRAESLDGYITDAYGIPLYEAPMISKTKEIYIGQPQVLSMGDRRRIKFENAKDIKSDTREYVVSERISFICEREEAWTAIKNLDDTV